MLTLLPRHSLEKHHIGIPCIWGCITGLYPGINWGMWRDDHSKALLQECNMTTHGPLLCYRHKFWCWKNRGVGKPPCLLHLTRDHVPVNQWTIVLFILVQCQSPWTYLTKNFLNLQGLHVCTFQLLLDPEQITFWWIGFACSRSSSRAGTGAQWYPGQHSETHFVFRSLVSHQSKDS